MKYASWLPFDQRLTGIGDSLENAQRVLGTLLAMLKGSVPPF
jgi:hypothetical protein